MEEQGTHMYLLKTFCRSNLYLILSICLFANFCYGKQVILEGAGEFVFDCNLGGEIKKIPVCYYCPMKTSPMTRVVFILHGSGRNGKVYRDEWQRYASLYNFIVICPVFSEKDFPYEDYNLGRVYDYDHKRYRKPEEWSFNVIEKLFDFVKQDRQLKAEAYCLFGHSAGAQFVHRMVLFMPQARFSMAIANGAGDYTAPVLNEVFPTGLKGTRATEESLEKSFGEELIVMMGAKDLVSKTMPAEGHFDEYDRVWRARIFFEKSKSEALRRGVPFKWRFILVPNADHNNPVYAEVASRLVAKYRIFLSPSRKDANDVKDVNATRNIKSEPNNK